MRSALSPKILGLLVLSVLVVSCAAPRRSITARTASIHGTGVMQNPVLVDLDVSAEKVTGTASGRRSEVNAVKIAAVSDAVTKANADVLVEPVYTTSLERGQLTVTVSGYPAVYTNFRPATERDVPLLEAGSVHKANVAKEAVGPEKKNGARVALLVFGTVAAITALLIAII
jgi:hypothetical protein